jgi:hypothetical protein
MIVKVFRVTVHDWKQAKLSDYTLGWRLRSSIFAKGFFG